MGEEKARILIVDDEPGVVEGLSEFLRDEGYETDIAFDGLEALEKLRENLYDLIITDIMMPNLKGLDLLQEVRKFKNPPAVIVMTGHASLDSAVESMKYGAHEYIAKPFNFAEMLKLVEKSLEIKKVEDENIRLKQMIENYRISEKMMEVIEEDKILEMLVDAAVKTTFGDVAFVGRYNKRIGHCTYKVGLSLVDSISPEELFEKLNFLTIKSYFDRGESIFLSDEDVMRIFSEPPPVKVYSVLMVPLRVRREHMGMVAVFSLTRINKFTEGDRKALVLLASRASVSLNNVELFKELQRTFTETIQGLVAAVEAKDEYTRGHSERVAYWAERLAKVCGCSDQMVEDVKKAALLHDIGKIGMDLRALTKEGTLSEKEFELFKTHPEVGKKILEPIKFLEPIIPMVYHHHERWDGEGYPEGIKGEEIPLGARIITIADSFDVMTSNRPYRKRLPFKRVVQELIENSGTQFDPNLVHIFLNYLASDEGKKALKELLPDYYEENREFIEKFTPQYLESIEKEWKREVESL